MRSGTSRMNTTQTSASTANGTATRNRWPVASPKACSKTARTGAGSVARSGIEPCSWEPIWIPSLVRPSATLAATWWLSTAPSAETPIEPPIDRKNATTELAAPRSDWATLFWTASTGSASWRRDPRPSTAM